LKTLQACYELEFNKINFLERKNRITHPKTILTGPPKSGKSYLIFDYLSHFKPSDYLYIDFSDLRHDKLEITNHLNSFVKEHAIKVLVLENFEFDFEFDLCDSVIITTSLNTHLKGFKKLQLHALDFEEFLLHDNRNQTITHSFNAFLKYGNLPLLISQEESKKIKRAQEVLLYFCKNSLTLEIFKILVHNIDEKKSLRQLFNALKQTHKISKDRFYDICKTFENNEVFYFIQKYKQPKATKKIYCYNHGYLSVVSHQKKFKNEFANMVFLELKSQGLEIFYHDYIDFYAPKKHLAVLCVTFFNELLIDKITKRIELAQKELQINEIYIVTIGNSQTLKLKNLSIQVLPFYEWALA
jgi:predicted AAA+ superfamily ATPase